MLGNGISLTLQIILFGMQFKLAKSLCTSEKGLRDQNPYLQDLLIRVLFSQSSFGRDLLTQPQITQYSIPQTSLKSWDIKMGGEVRDILLRDDLQSFYEERQKKHYCRTIKEYKIKCNCCVTKMTVKNILCDSWWFELLS